MEAATVPAVEKFVVRNNTAGYVGVVVHDHRGEPEGVNIEPHGTLYMSELDMIATARAPRRPEDNPFEEQTFIRVNPETQAREEFQMRTLTLESDSRHVPLNDRYVPTQVPPEGGDGAPVVEQASGTEQAPAATPPSSGSSEGTPPPAPVAPSQAVAPPVRTGVTPPPQAPSAALGGLQEPPGGEEEAQSWVEPPEAPGRVLAGSLDGRDPDGPPAAEAPEPTNHPATATGERFTPSVVGAQAAPQTPGEEHAAAVDPSIGEETGAAQPPQAPAPEGEYAQAEEVGSPEAPRNNDQTLIGE